MGDVNAASSARPASCTGQLLLPPSLCSSSGWVGPVPYSPRYNGDPSAPAVIPNRNRTPAPRWEATPTRTGNDAGNIPRRSSHGLRAPALPAEICGGPWAPWALPSMGRRQEDVCSVVPALAGSTAASRDKAIPRNRSALTLTRSLLTKQCERLDQRGFSRREAHCCLSFRALAV